MVVWDFVEGRIVLVLGFKKVNGVEQRRDFAYHGVDVGEGAGVRRGDFVGDCEKNFVVRVFLWENKIYILKKKKRETMLWGDYLRNEV